MATILRAAFWASLQREEGEYIRVNLTLNSPGPHDLILSTPVPLEVERLRKLAGAVLPKQYLGLSITGDTPYVWGITSIPRHFRVLVRDPGVMDVYYPGHLRYANGQARFMAQMDAQYLAARVARVLCGDGQADGFLHEKARTIVSFISELRDTRAHGGIIVVPNGAEWERRTSSRTFVTNPVYTYLATSVRELYELRQPAAMLAAGGELGVRESLLASSVANAVGSIVGMAGVDGAVMLDSELNVLGFGTMLEFVAASELTWRQANLASATTGEDWTDTPFERLGGSRHRSAAVFTANVPGSIALIASEDGPISMIWREGATGQPHLVRNVQLALGV